MVQALIILSVTLAALLILLGLFAYQSFAHGMPITPALKKKGSSKLLHMWVLEFAYWLLRPLVQGLVWCRIHPNTISWASVFFAGFGAIALTKGFFGYSTVLFIIAFLLDAVDGMVARMTNMVSDAGAVLDSTLDRYTEFLFFIGLLFYYRFEALALGLVAIALCGSWMVSYSSAKAEAIRIAIPRGTMRRPERLFVLMLGTAFAPIISPITEGNIAYPMHYSVLVSVAFVAIFSNCTAIYRVYWIYRKLVERANQDAPRSFPIHSKNAIHRLVRATLASSIPTSIDVAILLFLVEVAGLNYVLATIFAVTCGTIVSYLLRYSWFFMPGTKSKDREFSQLMVIAATNVIWNVMLVYGFCEWLELNYLVSRLIAATSVALVWNWPLNSRFMFPTSEPSEPTTTSPISRPFIVKSDQTT